MSDIITAMATWLPVPYFIFKGGPIDGERRAVTFHHTDHGVFAPEFWEVDPPLPRPGYRRKTVENITIERALYRFVPVGRLPNEGYYAFVPPSPVVQVPGA